VRERTSRPKHARRGFLELFIIILELFVSTPGIAPIGGDVIEVKSYTYIISCV
jgi:hypothetical protein